MRLGGAFLINECLKQLGYNPFMQVLGEEANQHPYDIHALFELHQKVGLVKNQTINKPQDIQTPYEIDIERLMDFLNKKDPEILKGFL